MKKPLSFFCLLLTIACVQAADLLVSDKPYSETGLIRTEKQKDTEEQTRTEYGQINTIPYVIYYADGKAVFGNASDPAENWVVTCKKYGSTYGSTSDVHCPIRKKGLSVYLYASNNDGVSIGPNIYPKSSATLLIEGEKPFSTKKGKKGVFDRKTGLTIINKLDSASRVRIRYAQWPEKKPFEEIIDMQGYNEAAAYARWAMTHLEEGPHP